MVVKDEDGWIHRREIMFEGSWYRLSLENCVGDVVFGVLCHLANESYSSKATYGMNQ